MKWAPDVVLCVCFEGELRTPAPDGLRGTALQWDFIFLLSPFQSSVKLKLICAQVLKDLQGEGIDVREGLSSSMFSPAE